MQPFKTIADRDAYADKCLKAGLDPEYVATNMGYRDVAGMEDSIHQSKASYGSSRRRHLTAMLKASHAARLMRKGFTPEKAAERCGYTHVRSMRRAIRQYTKSPAPTGIGNGADQNIHHQNTTKEAGCQCSPQSVP